tara:strand:- start:205 stop:621 length:417 start_codon:yes stop_codon:yes gene_type:complete
MDNNQEKPMPVPQPESDKYWNGLKKGEIWIQKCKSSGQFQFYPRSHSMYNVDGEIEWVKVSGDATLYTFAIVHVAPHYSFSNDVPFINALIKLKEGPIIPTNIVDVKPDPKNLKIGMKLKPVFVDTGQGITLLKFKPA